MEHSEETSTTARDIAAILFRHSRKATLAAAATFAVVVLWTFGTSKRFTSEMSLLVQNGRANDVITPGSGSTLSASQVTEEELNSQVAVLTSSDLLDDIVDPGWSSRNQKDISQAELTAHNKKIESLSSRLDISATRSSHVINVKLVANDPRTARDSLQALWQQALKKQSNLNRPAGSTQFFKEQADRSLADLERARAELATFQQEHGFVSLDAKETNLSQRLADLDAKLRENEVLREDITRRIKAGQVQLANTKERIPTAIKNGSSAGTIDNLTPLLVTLQNEQIKKSTGYKANDPEIKELNQQIEATRKAIEEATIRNRTESSEDINPIWQQTMKDLNFNVIQLGGLNAANQQLQVQIKDLEKDLSSSENLSGNFSNLQHKVTETENQYNLLVQKRDAAKMSDLMDQQHWLNLAIIQSPTLSFIPSHPRPLRDLFLGLITSLFMAIVVVFAAETLRGTVATPREVESVSQYPVLATIPFNGNLMPTQKRAQVELALTESI